MQKVLKIARSFVRANTHTHTQTTVNRWFIYQFRRKKKSERTYFASFTWRHAVVIARRLVSAYLARYNRFRRCTTVRIGSGKLLIWNGTRNERFDLCAISCASEWKMLTKFVWKMFSTEKLNLPKNVCVDSPCALNLIWCSFSTIQHFYWYIKIGVCTRRLYKHAFFHRIAFGRKYAGSSMQLGVCAAARFTYILAW